MARTTSTVILDSSGLVSLVRPDDGLHASALTVKQHISGRTWRLLLPHEVFAETLNVIGKRYGRGEAFRVATILLEGHRAEELVLAASDSTLLSRAAKLQQGATGGPSFIDCLVMVAAEYHATKYIFGFDATFSKNGFLVPGGATDDV